MNGWKIDLLMDTQEDNNAVNKDLRSNVPHLIWSSYDRINIKKVSKFEDFFVFDDSTVKWTGSIQSLHLFTHKFTKKHKISIRDKSLLTNDFLYDEESPDLEYSLAMIVSLKINEEVFCQFDIQKNEPIFDAIQDISLMKFPDCPIECFYSLGEEDIVLIALGNSVDKFMKLISALRRLYFYDNKGNKKTLCDFTNSFFMQNCKEYRTDIQCSESYANLYVALKKGINENTFFNAFIDSLNDELQKKMKVDSFAISTMMIGEYDVVLRLSTSEFGTELFNLYSEARDKNSLNAKSDFYKSYIKNSKTVWCFDTKDSSSNDTTETDSDNYEVNVEILNIDDRSSNTYSKTDDEIKNTLEELNIKVKTNEKNIQYAYHNVIYFLKEASLTLHSTTNKQWKYIISEQIMSFINLYKEFSEKFDETDIFDKYVSDLNEVISDMRNSFSHINRSHELFYHIPTTSLHYSGSFNAIILAYYNLINMLLDVAFKKPHNNTKQAKIVFFVYFGMTAKIQEKTYFKDSLEPDTTKLVGFELPYTALYDLEKYFISLTHEVYHLIAPYDRSRRNNMIEFLWRELLVKEQIIRIIANDLNIFDENDERYSLVLELVEQFFDNNVEQELFEIDNYSLLSVKVLNRKIVDKINSGLLSKKIETLYFDFCNYCKKIRSKKYKEVCSVIGKKIKGLKDPLDKFTIDRVAMANIQLLVDNISESICDTFMYQMSFSRIERPAEQYIKYIKDFFDERKVNYTTDKNAAFRIFLFILYNELNDGISISGLQLEEHLLYEIQKIFSSLFDCYADEQLELIKNIINEDNLLYSSKYCYSTEKFREILTEEEKIKANYIIPLSKNNNFDTCINIIYSLNRRFYLPEYKKYEVLNKYDDFKYATNCVICNKKEFIMPTHYANTLDDYLSIVRLNTSRNSCDEIWYRGICNYTYKLVPSLYVNLPKGKHPYLYQIECLRQCYDETKKYYNVLAEQENPFAARQSLMQHYGVPTNLLDFSTDPLASLYWALNPENSNDKKTLCTAVVYFFNPRKFIKACNYIREYYKIDDPRYIDLCGGIYSHNCLSDEYIIEKTTNIIINDKFRQYNYEISDKVNIVKNSYKKLPVPVIIPQQNIRINAQSGTFVAFNLLSLIEDGNYDYLALENIQKKFVELKDNNLDEKELFLERVLINPSCINPIKINMQETFKYSRKSVYPDLENLFESIKEKTAKYNKS